MSAEQIETCSKKGRGMARRSLDLIDAMHAEAEAAQPITGRGIATAVALSSSSGGSASTTPSSSAAITASPWSCCPGACGSRCSKR
jgi:hypothetical protein